MKIDQQIDMVRLIRKTNQGEEKVWRLNNEKDTAFVCREYAKTCTAVLKSLRKLKSISKRVEARKKI